MLYQVAQHINTRAERLLKKRKTDRLKPIETAALRFCIQKHGCLGHKEVEEAETIFKCTLRDLNVTITFDRENTHPRPFFKTEANEPV
jgi:hypothetical protein